MKVKDCVWRSYEAYIIGFSAWVIMGFAVWVLFIF